MAEDPIADICQLRSVAEMKVRPLLFLALASCSPSDNTEQQGSQPVKKVTVASSLGGSDYGSAIPIEPEHWIRHVSFSEIQYTPEIVEVVFEITPLGEAQNCQVSQPSASAFARRICDEVEENAKFVPARGADGKPTKTQGRSTFRFKFPTD